MKIKLTPGAKTPLRATDGAAGYDLFCLVPGDPPFNARVICPGETSIINTGVSLEIPPGWVGLIRGRSSAIKRDLLIIGGTIDSDYRGEIMLAIRNLSQDDVCVYNGERLAQLVIVAHLSEGLEAVDSLSSTHRGAGGFGSTGR